MILFAAIDLKEGKCVRLRKGALADATIYNDDPDKQAQAFCDLGFSWLHVVDLDGAFAGGARNAPAVEAILRRVGGQMKVQLGGGIRDERAIDAWLERGVSRVILGTAALRNPALVRKAAARHPGSIAVGIDARAGKVAVEGWARTSEMTAVELAGAFEGAGIAAIVYTDIDRDGMLAGINFEATLALAGAVAVPVIASGGLASMADVERLTRPDATKLAGAIAGRALYDGRIDARAALAMLSAGG